MMTISPRAFVSLALLVLSLAAAQASSAQELSSSQFERRAAGESSIDVEVRFGAGEFTLLSARQGHLYRATMQYREDDFEAIHTYSDGRLVVGLEGRSGARSLRQSTSESRLDLRLSPTVAQNLRMEMGAVRAEMDLGGIALRRLDLATGASETRVSVSSPNPIEMDELKLQVGAASFRADDIGRLNVRRITVEGGVGEVRIGLNGLTARETEISAALGMGALEIRVPDGVGVRLTRSSFLSSLTAPFLERRNGAHYSDDWDSASRRVRISVDSALGSVRIIREDG